MTLLGKVFTVLIFFMSVLFMGFAIMVYATHLNWKMVVDNPTPSAEHPELGLKQQVEQLSQVNKGLREEIERAASSLAVEQAARRFALAALQQQKSSAENERDQAAKQLGDLQACAHVRGCDPAGYAGSFGLRSRRKSRVCGRKSAVLSRIATTSSPWRSRGPTT